MAWKNVVPITEPNARQTIQQYIDFFRAQSPSAACPPVGQLQRAILTLLVVDADDARNFLLRAFESDANDIDRVKEFVPYFQALLDGNQRAIVAKKEEEMQEAGIPKQVAGPYIKPGV